MAKDEPKSFTCECGKVHEFGVYVFAHWYETLIHACDCGRQHAVRNGRAKLDKSTEPRKKRVATSKEPL